MIAPLPSVVLHARENDAVGGDADEEERSGRGGVDGGAVVVLQEAELDGTSMKLAVGFSNPKRPCARLWLTELARRSGSKLPGAELELADAQLASWAKAALVGWFYKPPTKVNHRPPNEAWLRPNGFRFQRPIRW